MCLSWKKYFPNVCDTVWFTEGIADRQNTLLLMYQTDNFTFDVPDKSVYLAVDYLDFKR